MTAKKAATMKGKETTSSTFDETRENVHRQILSTVSHDLKTPLATVIGSLEVYLRMEEKLSHEKKITLIKSALGEAYRLDSFVTNILDMAKLESGMVKIKNERCDLTTLLQDCVTRIGPRAERGSISLHPPTATTIVHTDPMLLGKAAGILLDNALKHAGNLPIIRLEYGVEDDRGYIRVVDNGAGVSPEKTEAIFSKYTRFSKSDQQNAGTGLGLAICRQIMGLLSGSVNVKNCPEGGAVFTLTFPCK